MKFDVKFIGWVLFVFGLVMFMGTLVGIQEIMKTKKIEFEGWCLLQIMNVLLIGVGGYLIKNFTEKK